MIPTLKCARIRTLRCAHSIQRTINSAIRQVSHQQHRHYFNQSNKQSINHKSSQRSFSNQSDAAALIGMSLTPASSNAAMWDSIVKVGLLTDDLAITCVKQVDRRLFVNQSQASHKTIYDPNLSLPIGCGATVATPVSQARALQAVSHIFHRDERVRVLDLGSGCGYMTHVLALMAGARGWTVGIEHANELVQTSDQIARRHFPQLIDQGRIQFIQNDARVGFEKRAPFDLIHSGIALEEIPSTLIDQLAPGGIALIPLVQADGQQLLTLIEKVTDQSNNQSNNQSIKQTVLGSCGYSKVRNAPPPSGHDSIDAFKAETQQLISRMKEIEDSIKQWRARQSKKVTLADFEADDVMASTLKEYSLIKKKVQARLRIEAQQVQ